MNDFKDAIASARTEIESRLIARADGDAAFRELLMADPHAALRALLGQDPVSSLRIRVIAESPGEIVLVLPRTIDADELPDEMLDFASGGNAKECWWKLNQWAYDQKWLP